MNKKIFFIASVVTLAVGLTIWAGTARTCDKHRHKDYCEIHKKCDKYQLACSEEKCILKQRKECVCFYVKKSAELGLSEDQITKLKKLDNESRKIMIRNNAEVEIIKVEINELLDEKKPDANAINARIDKISQLKAESKKACMSASLEARDILTEEQYKLSKNLGKVCPLPEKKCNMTKTEK